MTKLLASVTDVGEAMLALESGADIIDLKNPAQGALGALPLDTIRQAVRAVDGRRPVSATIGDLPMRPDLLVDRVRATLATGVDIVKVGFFGQTVGLECAWALAPLAGAGARMVAVLFADQHPDFKLLPVLGQAGFHGAMLDTVAKDGKRLTDHFAPDDLRNFVVATHNLSMLAGLAGSLSPADISLLASLRPDYLGFRGALCENGDRGSSLQTSRLIQLKSMLRNYNKPVVQAL